LAFSSYSCVYMQPQATTTTTTTAQHDSWSWGGTGESCTTVCHARGTECSFADVTVPTSVSALQLLDDGACGSYAEGCARFLPARGSPITKCIPWTTAATSGTCSIGAIEKPRCSTAIAGYQRLCFCKATAPPPTVPAAPAPTGYTQGGINCNCGNRIAQWWGGRSTAQACAAECTARGSCLSFGLWTTNSKGHCALFDKFCEATCPTPTQVATGNTNDVYNKEVTCNSGHYTRRRGTSCDSCSSVVRRRRAQSCTSCPDGQKPLANSDACQEVTCNIGHYTRRRGTSCDSCSGVVRRRRAQSCTSCPAGHAPSVHSDDCDKAAPTLNTDGYSFRFSLDVRFNNWDGENYPRILTSSTGAFAFTGFGPAYGGDKGKISFYIQTVDNVGAHGRGAKHSTSSAKLNQGVWYRVTVEKTADQLCIQLGTDTPACETRTVTAEQFQMISVGLMSWDTGGNIEGKAFVEAR